MTDILIEQEQGQPHTPTIDDIAMVCESLVTGIRMCLKRIAGDDIFKRRLEGMIDEVGQLELDVVKMLNANTGEYNELVDECENLQSANGLLQHKNNELEAELNASAQCTAQMLESERAAHVRKRQELEGIITQLTNEVEVLNSTAKVLVSEKRVIKGQLDDLQRLQPERLKAQNAKLKLSNADLTKNNSAVNTELTRLYRAHNRIQVDLARAESHVAELNADLHEYKRFDDLVSGEHVIERFCMVSERNQLIAFYPYIFKWGLNVWEGEALAEPKRRNDYDLMFIQGLDFHIQIRSTLGMDITCKLSEFGRALYLLPDELKKFWPDGLDKEIQDYHLEQLERLSTPLYDRSIWCREQHITTLDFVPEKFHDALIEMGLDNLMMIGGSTYEELKHIKGMGAATFNKIREGALHMLESYQHESGPIKLTIEREHTKPPLARRIEQQVKARLAEIKARSKQYGMEGDA